MQKAGELSLLKISHSCHGLVRCGSGSVSYTSCVTSNLGDLVTCLASLHAMARSPSFWNQIDLDPNPGSHTLQLCDLETVTYNLWAFFTSSIHQHISRDQILEAKQLTWHRANRPCLMAVVIPLSRCQNWLHHWSVLTGLTLPDIWVPAG